MKYVIAFLFSFVVCGFISGQEKIKEKPKEVALAINFRVTLDDPNTLIIIGENKYRVSDQEIVEKILERNNYYVSDLVITEGKVVTIAFKLKKNATSKKP